MLFASSSTVLYKDHPRSLTILIKHSRASRGPTVDDAVHMCFYCFDHLGWLQL